MVQIIEEFPLVNLRERRCRESCLAGTSDSVGGIWTLGRESATGRVVRVPKIDAHPVIILMTAISFCQSKPSRAPDSACNGLLTNHLQLSRAGIPQQQKMKRVL